MKLTLDLKGIRLEKTDRKNVNGTFNFACYSE